MVTWYRYRPGVAQRVGRGIALLFHDRSTPRPHFTPCKDPVPILQGARWDPGRVLDGRKISSPPGFDPYWWVCFFVFCGAAAQRGPWPPHFWGFLMTHNDAPQSVGLLWTSDQLVAETSTWQHITLTTDKHPCLPVGFEPTISASERPQTYALDRAATGTGLTDGYRVSFSVGKTAGLWSLSLTTV